jgi:hypothetical protein
MHPWNRSYAWCRDRGNVIPRSRDRVLELLVDIAL